MDLKYLKIRLGSALKADLNIIIKRISGSRLQMLIAHDTKAQSALESTPKDYSQSQRLSDSSLGIISPAKTPNDQIKVALSISPPTSTSSEPLSSSQNSRITHMTTLTSPTILSTKYKMPGVLNTGSVSKKHDEKDIEDKTGAGSNANSLRVVDEEMGQLMETLDAIEGHVSGERPMRGGAAGKTLKTVRQKILRLNLAKNLIKNELKNIKDESQLERRMFLKSVSSFERNLELIRSENEAINEKNLKLIRYCRKLKNGRLKRLKAENTQLRQSLEQALDHQEDSLNLNRSRKLRTDSVLTNDTVVASRQNSNVSMLDTLGRLASHVLADESTLSSQGPNLHDGKA